MIARQQPCQLRLRHLSSLARRLEVTATSISRDHYRTLIEQIEQEFATARVQLAAQPVA